ncbi:MAG: hypothetical protein Q4B62_03430 [Clostridiaceae bacterium]|nr:hypothetical protein [Clostridiaceae bacterium]
MDSQRMVFMVCIEDLSGIFAKIGVYISAFLPYKAAKFNMHLSQPCDSLQW